MAQIPKTFVMPEIADAGVATTQPVLQNTVGRSNVMPNYGLLAQLGGGKKTSQATSGLTASVPVQYESILAARNTVGNARDNLYKALQMREDPSYKFGSTLADMSDAQGYGSFATDFVKALGLGMTRKADLEVDRAKRDYEAADKDLARALSYDVALGTIKDSSQNQNIGYGDDLAAQYELLSALFG